MRYEIYNPIFEYYQKNEHVGYDTLIKEDGYKFNSAYNCNNWLAEKIQELTEQGYVPSIVHDCNGGDNDMLVTDHLRKQYCFWENGFAPFYSSRADNLPTDGDLEYHYENRS